MIAQAAVLPSAAVLVRPAFGQAAMRAMGKEVFSLGSKFVDLGVMGAGDRFIG